jgi:hypothetical protein
VSAALREAIHAAALAVVAVTVIVMIAVGIHRTPPLLALAGSLAALVAGRMRAEDAVHVPSDAREAATYSLPVNRKRASCVCAADAPREQSVSGEGHPR